jgi:hypothetical protein
LEEVETRFKKVQEWGSDPVFAALGYLSSWFSAGPRRVKLRDGSETVMTPVRMRRKDEETANPGSDMRVYS